MQARCQDYCLCQPTDRRVEQQSQGGTYFGEGAQWEKTGPSMAWHWPRLPGLPHFLSLSIVLSIVGTLKPLDPSLRLAGFF